MHDDRKGHRRGTLADTLGRQEPPPNVMDLPPPSDLDAEETVLGAILGWPTTVLDDVAEIVSESDFYRVAHRTIFGSMLRLRDARIPIDVITIVDELKQSNLLQEANGPVGVSKIAGKASTSVHAVTHARIVKKLAIRRRIVEAAEIALSRAKSGMGDEKEILEEAEAAFFAIGQASTNRGGFRSNRELVKEAYREIETRNQAGSDVTGVSTGFAELDKATAGMQPGDFIVIAARPSMGKTSFAIGMADYVAIKYATDVAVFSLEMKGASLTLRSLASEARINSERLRNGSLDEADWNRLAMAVGVVGSAPVHVDDASTLTLFDIRARSRRLAAQLRAHGRKLGMVMIDYLQLISAPGLAGFTRSRDQEIAEITRGLKALAKELECPVVALSQLNRSLEQRQDKRPMMSDLRESGAIEQDSDLILFLYRDDVYNKRKKNASGNKDVSVCEVIIGKQRNGPTGTVELAFLKPFTRFENLEEADRPEPEAPAPRKPRKGKGQRSTTGEPPNDPEPPPPDAP